MRKSSSMFSVRRRRVARGSEGGVRGRRVEVRVLWRCVGDVVEGESWKMVG
jgi:hypothetical protein